MSSRYSCSQLKQSEVLITKVSESPVIDMLLPPLRDLNFIVCADPASEMPLSIPEPTPMLIPDMESEEEINKFSASPVIDMLLPALKDFNCITFPPAET